MPNSSRALMALTVLVPFASARAQAIPAQTAAAPKIEAKLDAPAKVGDNRLRITLANSDKSPLLGAKVSLTVAMTNMDMGTTRPKVAEEGKGVYTATVAFSMRGPWRVTVSVEPVGGKKATKSFDFKAAAAEEAGSGDMPGMGHGEMAGMAMDTMKGKLGSWSMSKEGSGTSWLPESSPMFMKMLPKAGRYDLSLMGFITFDFSDAGGKRGERRFYSNSMPMLMARRETGGGTVGANLMLSLDPIFNGEYGYPNLFQTGETAYGKPLVDYQHPHDLVSELTASYSKPIGGGLNAFVYGGPVGEPALGGPTFAHRPSGMEIPQAPISHHWFDSTHIAWGVATVGLNSSKWQVEGSLFNGHEPDENRYSPDPLRLNSASGRVTYSPTAHLAFNASYGYLNSPESKEPGVDQHRFTASGIWSLPLRGEDDLSVTAAFGRNYLHGGSSDAFLLEGTYLRGKDQLFARWENVDKDELVGVPIGSYKVNKFLFGGVRNLATKSGFDVGLGGYAGLYAFPGELKPYYGSAPVTLGVFLRVRPSRM